MYFTNLSPLLAVFAKGEEKKDLLQTIDLLMACQLAVTTS